MMDAAIDLALLFRCDPGTFLDMPGTVLMRFEERVRRRLEEQREDGEA